MPKRSRLQTRNDGATKRLHQRDEEKESFWRENLGLWRKSGQSKRAYCDATSVSYSSLVWWGREIERRDREQVARAQVGALVSKPRATPASPFVPIRLLPETKGEPKPTVMTPKASTEQHQIEIALPNGVVIRLHDGCNPAFIGNSLSALKA